MKKLILTLIINISIFTLSAEILTREYTTDKETGEAVVIETHDGKEDGVIERRIQGSALPVATIIKEVFSSDNKYNYTYTITYNMNLETGIFDKKEFFYNEKSLMEYSVATVQKEDDVYFIVINSDFKPNNIENLTKTIDTLTLKGNNKVKSIFFYNQNKRLSQSYFEYDNNQVKYVKSSYKTHPDGMKTLENYYSYPDYTYEKDNPYLQISTYENNPHGIIQEIYKENSDGTHSHEYIVNPDQRNTRFTRDITVYTKDGEAIYSEQYYEKELYGGKAFRVVEYWGEGKKVEKVSYYDKDGNEIKGSN